MEHPAASPHALEIHNRLGKYRKARWRRHMRARVQLLTERYLELVIDPAVLGIPLPGITVLSGNERRRLDVLEILQTPRIHFADRHGGGSMPSKNGQRRPTIVQTWLSVPGHRPGRRLRVRAAFFAA